MLRTVSWLINGSVLDVDCGILALKSSVTPVEKQMNVIDGIVRICKPILDLVEGWDDNWYLLYGALGSFLLIFGVIAYIVLK